VESFRRKTAAAAAQRATAASDLGVLALAEQVGHHEATQTAPPQNAAPDQHAHELALMAATFLFTAAFLVLVFLGAASFLHAVAEQVGHHEATQPAAAQYASADQQAHELAFLAAAALFTALLVLVLFPAAALLLHALAEQVGQQEPTQTTAPQNASTDQQAHELTFLAAAALFTAFLVFILFPAAASLLHAVVEQVGQHEPTQAAAAYSPADQHANKSALLATPFAAFAVDVGAFEDIVHSRGVIWHCNLAPKS
jgi:ABC-type Fe3+ transport system permease subunit